MPIISLFYGIVIYMYKDDHNPPHIHAVYQSYEAVYDFDGNAIKGELPPKKAKLVIAWIAIHKEDLEADWRLVDSDQRFFRIDPLR